MYIISDRVKTVEVKNNGQKVIMGQMDIKLPNKVEQGKDENDCKVE